MTRRCVYCKTPHVLGQNFGPPYTDTLCWKAVLREDVKWYAPIWARAVEAAIGPLALIYLACQVFRWSTVGFKIVGN